MPVLTAIDTLGVQRFIFSSNRLRDVVAGSWLVHWSTDKNGALKELEKEQILLAAGGNAILRFRSLNDARDFTARYSRKLYDEAPGLEVAIAHREYDEGSLAETLLEIQKYLARSKNARKPDARLLGISVTASCQETGLPANGFDRDEPDTPLSRQILLRRKKNDLANSHWSVYLKNYPDFDFPMELDDMGRSVGDTSLIGVVHIDGNGIGKQIKEWLEDHESKSDEAVRKGYLDLSAEIDKIGKTAFQKIVDTVCKSVDKAKRQLSCSPKDLSFDLKCDQKIFLPLRPILLGGDDLTFVCDGRIALSLAEVALREFENYRTQTLSSITAAAGVAIVRVRTPFARVYRLSEALCSSAKNESREKSVIDWHIGMPRPSESVSEIRERQYKNHNNVLTCRPYLLNGGLESWTGLSQTLLKQLRSEHWSGRRNKVKELPRLVREGSESVKKTFESWKALDEQLSLPSELENGFISNRTPLIDAVELLDLHLELKGGVDAA